MPKDEKEEMFKAAKKYKQMLDSRIKELGDRINKLEGRLYKLERSDI